LFKTFKFIFDDVEERFLPQDYLLKNILRRILHVLESNPVDEYFKILNDAISCNITLTSPFHPVAYFFKRISTFLFKPKGLTKKELPVSNPNYRPVDYLSDCAKGVFPLGVSLMPRNWSCVRDAKLVSDARDHWPECPAYILQKYPILRLIYNLGLWFKFYDLIDIIRDGKNESKALFIIPESWEFDFVCPQDLKRQGFSIVENAARERILSRVRARQLQNLKNQ